MLYLLSSSNENIIEYREKNLLTQRNEFISKCRQKTNLSL